MLGREVQRAAATRAADETACTILESAVLPPRDSEGRYTFSVRYQYYGDGRRYEFGDYSTQPMTSAAAAYLRRNRRGGTYFI